jgi:4'-phosphopantetheinyl transferase
MHILSPHESHLWMMRVGDILEHQSLKVVSEAFLRHVLSQYAEISPQDWKFQKNPKGKPEIYFPDLAVPLNFNLSHTSGLMVCAVVRNHAVGVDAEQVERKIRFLELAERYFSNEEVRHLKSLPQDQQRTRFFEYWTLREAFIKARGESLGALLSHISFAVSEQNQIQISWSKKIQDDPKQWQFSLMKPSPFYQIAVAIRKGSSAELLISEKWFDPNYLSF